MKTKMMQPLVPQSSPLGAFHPNGALGRLVEQASNPYHALHIAKAFQLKSPKVNHKPQPAVPPVGNPWEMLK